MRQLGGTSSCAIVAGGSVPAGLRGPAACERGRRTPGERVPAVFSHRRQSVTRRSRRIKGHPSSCVRIGAADAERSRSFECPATPVSTNSGSFESSRQSVTRRSRRIRVTHRAACDRRRRIGAADAERSRSFECPATPVSTNSGSFESSRQSVTRRSRRIRVTHRAACDRRRRIGAPARGHVELRGSSRADRCRPGSGDLLRANVAGERPVSAFPQF